MERLASETTVTVSDSLCSTQVGRARDIASRRMTIVLIEDENQRRKRESDRTILNEINHVGT